MKLVDMKRPKRKVVRNGPELATMEDKYPFGLTVRLEKDQMAKLPSIKNVKAGEVVSLISEAKVISTRIEDNMRGGENHTVELQLQKIAVEPKKALKDMGMKEYINARNSGKG
jgi:hypothetical protein